MKKIVLIAILLGVSACATRAQVDPLMIPPDHDLVPTESTGQ